MLLMAVYLSWREKKEGSEMTPPMWHSQLQLATATWCSCFCCLIVLLHCSCCCSVVRGPNGRECRRVYISVYYYSSLSLLLCAICVQCTLAGSAPSSRHRLVATLASTSTLTAATTATTTREQSHYIKRNVRAGTGAAFPLLYLHIAGLPPH